MLTTCAIFALLTLAAASPLLAAQAAQQRFVAAQRAPARCRALPRPNNQSGR